MNLPDRARHSFEEHQRVIAQAQQQLIEPLVAGAQVLVEAMLSGGRVLACGNGVSAADADHFVSRMLNRFDRERPGLPAISLCQGNAALTSIANDQGYDQIFAKQISSLGQPGDVLLIFSSAGNSPNLMPAASTAQERKMRLIAICGGDGGGLGQMMKPRDLLIASNVGYVPRTLELHRLLVHCLCDLIDVQLLGG